MDRQGWLEILKEVEALYELHERSVSDAGKCREFNSRLSLFLDRLESQGATAMADRVMDLLGGCSPKDFSPCENRQNTKGALERLKERVRVALNESQ